MFNPAPRIQTVTIHGRHVCHVIDDALLDPDAMVEYAARHIGEFIEAGHNGYPGPELRMPEGFSTQLDAFFAAHLRRAFDVRRTERMYSRLAIATTPHWHALISIAAMQAGKDVMCEKPMTRFIAEGRAVVEAEQRYGRVFQVCTFGRFGASRDNGNIQTRKILTSGLLPKNEGVYVKTGGLKVKEWSGLVNAVPQPVPSSLDWDMYCGPSPLRPYHPHRVGGTHRGYWDYEGGGLCDMAQHTLDPVCWTYGRDVTGPVEAIPHAPPAHPEVCGMWGWVELRYADGFTLVLDSGEWGERWNKKPSRGIKVEDLPEEAREKLKTIPDPEPLLTFGQAVRTRKLSGGSAEAAHRTVSVIHLANIAIRVGRPIRFDPVKETIIADDEAQRLAHQPMRAPWHL